MKKITRALFAVLAFGTVSTGALNSAHAWHVQIDCNAPGVSSSWASTVHAINVFVTVGGVEDLWGTFSVPQSRCQTAFGITIYGHLGQSGSQVQSVRVQNLGFDEFWVDNIRVLESNGTTIHQTETENWCLSTEPSDGGGFNPCPPATTSHSWNGF